jgi:hypothetical protein
MFVQSFLKTSTSSVCMVLPIRRTSFVNPLSDVATAYRNLLPHAIKLRSGWKFSGTPGIIIKALGIDGYRNELLLALILSA